MSGRNEMKVSTESLEGNGAVVIAKNSPLGVSLAFAFVCSFPFLVAWNVTKELGVLIINNDSFSQILLVPLVTAFLIFEKRRRVFSEPALGPILMVGPAIAGLGIAVVARLNPWQFQSDNRAILLVVGVLLVWISSFVLFFGTGAFRAAQFPLLFLTFCIPIPEPLHSAVVRFLQQGSAAVTAIFLKLAGVPYVRQEFVFQLPNVAIRVAEECSGIRSSLALLITTVLASNLFLRTQWRRLVLCLVVVPLAIFKNGLRIATLSTLANYVDPGFLTGNLHRRGGIFFFMIALVPLALLLFWLQRSERRDARRQQVDGSRPVPAV
jgi:exosortase